MLSICYQRNVYIWLSRSIVEFTFSHFACCAMFACVCTYVHCTTCVLLHARVLFINFNVFVCCLNSVYLLLRSSEAISNIAYSYSMSDQSIYIFQFIHTLRHFLYTLYQYFPYSSFSFHLRFSFFFFFSFGEFSAIYFASFFLLLDKSAIYPIYGIFPLFCYSTCACQ